MPYIRKSHRLELSADVSPTTAGELNFVITQLCNDYLRLKGLGYAEINEVVGVLECAKLEFYRRIAAPYEDKKVAENGDVYTVVP